MSPSQSERESDDAVHIATPDGPGTLCGAPPIGRDIVAYDEGRTVNPASGCWMCIGNFRGEVGW